MLDIDFDTTEFLVGLGLLFFTYLILPWLLAVTTGIISATYVVNVSEARAAITGLVIGLAAIPLNVFWLLAGHRIIGFEDFLLRYLHIWRYLNVLHLNIELINAIAGPIVFAGIAALVTWYVCYRQRNAA